MQGERAPPAAQGEREPQATGRADLANLDYRLREIERKAKSGAYARKKEGLAGELEEFLRDIPGGGDLATVNEQNIRRFLVHKDRKGRTQTHGKDCKHLGAHGLKDCECPRRLAAGQLRALFRKLGRGEAWDQGKGLGNPACAESVREYLKVIKSEHSEAGVTPKQAKPLFLGKLEQICDYLSREIECEATKLRDRFIFLRDRAFFSVQSSAGLQGG